MDMVYYTTYTIYLYIMHAGVEQEPQCKFLISQYSIEHAVKLFRHDYGQTRSIVTTEWRMAKDNEFN